MLETETMGWTCFSHAESRSLTAAGETTLVMRKGPAHLWSSFFIGRSDVSGITESWGLKLLCYLLCLQGSDTEEKESWSSVTSSPNDKQIDPALWLWQSKQG